MVFNQWRWWRQCCPYWRIDYGGDVIIKRDGEGYKIQCPLYLEFTSRHDRYDTDVDCYNIRLNMYHKGRRWEKAPYELFGEIIEPAIKKFKLPPRGTARVGLICETITLQANPLPFLENYVTCKVSGYMDASISAPNVTIFGRVKKEGSGHLQVKVLLELIDDTRREDAS